MRTFKGFTLVELMITISIIAVLIAISAGIFANLQKSGRDAKRKSDLATIQSALEQYHADQGYYPLGSVIVFDGGHSLSFGTKTYLTKIPSDSNLTYIYKSFTSSTLTTECTTTSCPIYCLYAYVENPSSASSNDCPDQTSGVKTYNYEVKSP